MTIQELINKLQNETTEEQKKLPVMMYVMFDWDSGGYVPVDEIMIVENGTYYAGEGMFEERFNGTFLILGDNY